MGADQLKRDDGAAILALTQKLCSQLQKQSGTNWRIFNILQKVASQVAALDLGYKPGVEEIRNANPKILYLLNADQETISRHDLPKDCLVIYQGHHGDRGAEMADIILPGTAYTEKQATYVNTEGRAQQTIAAVSPPGMARDDWKILRAISELAGQKLPYDDFHGVRDRLAQVAPNLTHYGCVEEANFFAVAAKMAQVFGF